MWKQTARKNDPFTSPPSPQDLTKQLRYFVSFMVVVGVALMNLLTAIVVEGSFEMSHKSGSYDRWWVSYVWMVTLEGSFEAISDRRPWNLQSPMKFGDIALTLQKWPQKLKNVILLNHKHTKIIYVGKVPKSKVFKGECLENSDI